MPGLVGIVGARDDERAKRRFETACGHMLRHGGMELETTTAFDGRCRVGRIRLGTSDSCASSRVMFHGVLHNWPELKDRVDAGVAPNGPADLVWQLYDRHGIDGFRMLEGEFCFALVDRANERVVLATDVVGTYPVYWRTGSDFVFGSDLSAVLQASERPARLDMRAVADFLTIGAVLGDKTLAAEVKLIEPGSAVTVTADGEILSSSRYEDVDNYFQPKTNDKSSYFPAVGVAFARAVSRASRGQGSLGLSLSGGLDSRAILSNVNGHGPALTTCTLGVDGCADQAIAAKLARIAGSEQRFFPLDRRYLRDFLPNMRRMVSLTGGMYLSHGLTEMLALDAIGETNITVLLRGHGGELAKAHLAWPLHTDARIRDMNSTDEVVPYLSERANYVTPDLPLAKLLRSEAAAAAGRGSRDSFAEVLSGTGLSPAECCSYLYLRELHRRFTGPSLDLFRTRVDVRLPFVDPVFLKTLLGAPAEWRDSMEIHRLLIGAGLPELLEVRNSNTGARVDASPLAEALLDKWNTAMRRLNVRGYRHYHDFDGWMRRSLLDGVESELLAPDARVQQFVTRDTLADLVQDTRTGRRDRSYVLQVLLVLELWQKENHVEGWT